MPSSWALLQPHAARDALWLVVGAELPVVGAAIASDDTAAVQAWIDAEILRRPTSSELDAWQAKPVTFEALIVQPFVLARTLDI